MIARSKPDKTDSLKTSLPWTDCALNRISRRNNVSNIFSLSVSADVPDCYIGMFRYPKAYKEHCDRTGSVSNCSPIKCYSDYVWFDIDDRNVDQSLIRALHLIYRIREYGEEILDYVEIYFSGCKGLHIGIPSALFGLEPSADFPLRARRIAEHIAGGIKIDTSIYERNRLWRVPNTQHGKSSLYKVKLTLEQLSTWSIDQIREFAKEPQGQPYVAFPEDTGLEPHPILSDIANSADSTTTQLPNGGGNRVTNNPPGWISQALENLSEGNRNNTFTRIAGRLNRDDWTPQDIETLLLPHANEHEFPPKELKSIVNSITSRYPSMTRLPISPPYIYWKQEIGSPNSLSLDQLLKEADKKNPWLVQGVFPEVGVGIIGGAPGIGKSWLLLDLALSCALGESWLGQIRTLKGPVLYVDEESHTPLLAQRCRQLLAGGKTKPEGGLEFLVGKGICFTDPASLAILTNILDVLQPKLVICDSFIRFHQADENSATEMARVNDILKHLVRDYQCFILLADHHRKPGATQTGSQFMLRGSSEKTAFVDSQLSASRDGQDIKVEHSKSRYGITIPTFRFRIEEKIKGQVRLVCCGSDYEIKLQEVTSAICEFLKDNGLTSRKDIQTYIRDEGFTERQIDTALNSLVSNGKLERSDQRPEGGRGGKSAHYRLVDNASRNRQDNQ